MLPGRFLGFLTGLLSVFAGQGQSGQAAPPQCDHQALCLGARHPGGGFLVQPVAGDHLGHPDQRRAQHLRLCLRQAGVLGDDLGDQSGALAVHLPHALADSRLVDQVGLEDQPERAVVAVDELDLVILSALEIDLDFNVNVVTGSDGVMMGASGGHCDTAAGANLSIIVGPLIRGRIPTVVPRVTTLVTPGENVGVLVTDHGIAVHPSRPEVRDRLVAAGLPVTTIEELYARATAIAGVPAPLEFDDRIVGLIRYRDGSVIDVVRQVAGGTSR